MKYAVIRVWILALVLIVVWVCGLATGFSLGKVYADTCTGWSGRWVNFSNCGGQQCSGFSFGPFYTSQCSDPYYPPPPPPVAP